MRRHAAEALAVLAAALLVTAVIALPVLRAPSERIFGAEIVGRHHDPFTVMRQFVSPIGLGLYLQPVTDLTGAALARAAGAVAAYNWLVLLSFPLSAVAAYLLARHLALPPPAALLAALLFAFSPFHVAHAAYHPHIAQTQWLPLYLLALWRCLDEASWPALAFLAAATAAVTLSNFYGGLIAAVITPVAIGAYWLVRARFAPRAARHLGVTAAALAVVCAAGLTLVAWRAPAVLSDRGALAFVREDLFSYSAKWWSYVVPPVANPILGPVARQIWSGAHITVELLEQQVSLGWSVVVLALIAVQGWIWRPRRAARTAPLPLDAMVPALAVVAVAALLCSLSPERAVLGVRLIRPSALLYPLVPMFRAYARFGVVVQLMTALLAGIGAARLTASRNRLSRAACAGLILLAAAEYAVWPPAMSRDVLPTEAHRWVMRQTRASRVFDCEPLTPASAAVPWLTDGRISLAIGDSDACTEPQVAAKLWAAGFTHVIVRDDWQRRWLRDHGDAEGIHLQAHFDAADVLSVQPRDLIYTQAISGFWPREYAGRTTWRWMGADASWTIVTPTARARAMLELDLRAFHVRRPLAVRLDGDDERTLDVDQDARTYRIGPLALTAGPHLLTFHSTPPPTPADEVIGNGDRRALSISMGSWKWSEQ